LHPAVPISTLSDKPRALVALALALTAGLAGLMLARPSLARASRSQVTIMEDDQAMLSDPANTLAAFRALGANTVRVQLPWSSIAPDPSSPTIPAGFNATDPNSYPQANWAPFDQIVENAARDGMTVDLTVAGGAPLWAEGPGVPTAGGQAYSAWKPNATLYGQFVQAAGLRYDGQFTPPGASAPLPRVHFWAIWNEANFGEDLGPQAIDGSTVSVAPMMYRAMVDAAWTALHQTGHVHDTILIGEFAAQGLSAHATVANPGGWPGDYGQTKPLIFIRTMYCVDAHYKQLRGRAAKAVGCPLNAPGSRRFRAHNPGLFNATGVGDHPYAQGGPPAGGTTDPNYATFPQLGKLENVLDRVNRVYGSRRRYPIYSDEYGYITRPPAAPPYASPTNAAYYLNWAEYLSWKNPRIASYCQYLLEDPPPSETQGDFASGLEASTGVPKATYFAFRLPLYLPQTRLRRSHAAEVWGDLRPAQFEALDTGQAQTASIQFQPGGRGAFETIRQLTLRSGYFDLHLKFRAGGNLRLAYTYPAGDPLLPVGTAGTTVYSRLVWITVRR
jgi:hypothetical protein